ncbi:hypothetical protein [Paenibacillus timonensis]|uniref:hypothetical protein n=1 Tax=Paenibacillus timonensis TaxID=225915 RepID=UPI003F94574A
MATEIGELRARLTAESKEIKAEIRATKQDFADLGEQGKKTAGDIGTLNTALGRVGNNKDQINRLTSVLDNVNAKIEIQRKKLAELKQSYDSTFDSAKKSKLQEQIVNTEGVLIRLTQTSDQTAQKIWALEDSLNQAGAVGQQAATQMDALDDALKGIGLNADQIKTIKRHLDEADPSKLDHQLDELSSALRRLGVDSKQIEKITNELRQSEREAQKTKQGISGLASGLAALGAGAATVKLVNVMKSLTDETNQLANSYRGLSVVSEKFNVDSEASVDLAEKLADRWGLNKGTIADTVKTYLTMNLTLDETEKLITATADAAAYNRQAHLNWDEAIKQVSEGIKSGNSNLTDAAGITTNLSVMYDRYAKSIGTTAAKLTEAQKVQAAYNGMMQEASIFAGNADSAMTGYNGTQATFNQTIQMARQELGEAFLPVMQQVIEEIVPLVKSFTEWASENKEVVAGVGAATIAVTALIAVVGALSAAFLVLNSTMGPIGWIALAIGAVVAGTTAYSMAANAASDSVLQLAKNQDELNQKLNESPTKRSVADLKAMQTDTKTLNELLEERAKLQGQVDDIMAKGELGQGTPALLSQAMDINKEIEKIDKKLKDMDFDSADDAIAALKRMNDEIEKSVPALIDMKRAELQDLAAKNQKIASMEKLVTRYKELSGAQKLDQAQKTELISITNQLKAEYPDLHALMDQEGRIRIQNIDYIEDQIGAERALIQGSVDSAKSYIANLQKMAEAQRVSVETQIKNYEKLLKAMQAVSGAQSTGPKKESGTAALSQANPLLGRYAEQYATDNIKPTQDKLNELYDEQNRYAQAELELKKLANSLNSSGLDTFLPSGAGATGAAGGEEKKKNQGKTAAELRKEAYDAAIATVQYQAEMYDWTANQQIKAYEKVRKQHQKHLKESIEDERQMNLQIKRLQEDSVKSRYDFSAEWIDREERRMEESGKTEIEIAQMKIDAWTRVRDRYAKDSEYYKQADEELYRVRKDLIKLQEDAEKEAAKAREERIQEYQKQNDDLLKSELKAIEKAKRAELDAIDKRRQEYLDAQNEKIAAIDELLKKEEELNVDADYETQLAEKMARRELLSTAVSPEGRKELADITAEIERMQLEHSRELRKRDLEDQKDKLEDEKDEKEQAYDEEKRLTEERYEALTEALEEHQGDIEFIETAIKDFRITANQEANDQILSDLDQFVSEYRSRMAEITSLSTVASPGGSSGGGSYSQAELDLAEYNENKEAWDAARVRGDKEEMARLTARNEEIRRMYGIEKDTGKLPSFDVGGVVPGPIGAPMEAIIHGGEVIFNPGQFENMFRRLTAPAAPVFDSSPSPVQHIENHFDMSVGTVEIGDRTDAEIIYTERERTARRLATTGGGK